MAELAQTLVAAADRVAALSGPLGAVFERELFGGEPPEIVTWVTLMSAMNQLVDGQVPTHASLEAAAASADAADTQVDEVLFGSSPHFETPYTAEDLLWATAEALRGAATRLDEVPPAETADAEKYVWMQARAFLLRVVMLAQITGAQTQVVDLAELLGVPSVPFPKELRSQGEA